jgi:SAM-dependent methyltransferase
MQAAQSTTHEQSALWNGSAGHAWVESQALLDRMYAPFERLLLDAVAAASPRRLLDVGCGTGATTLAAARLLRAQGHCTGIDISAPMIAAARARGATDNVAADFIRADAQTHAFVPASMDMIISRFGVMFFDDAVQAFANLRRAATSGAQLHIQAWRSPAENEFMTTAERTAAPLLPNFPARDPDAPGQFAFAKPDRVRRILHDSGWAGIDIRAIDIPCQFPTHELIGYFTRLGPVGRVLHQADEHTRTRVVEAVRAAFEPYVHGEQVHFTAACWMASAHAASATTRSHGALDA